MPQNGSHIQARINQAKKISGHVSLEDCQLQTHPSAPPFPEAQSVPADSYKTVTDAWQGFHMIPLHTGLLTDWC